MRFYISVFIIACLIGIVWSLAIPENRRPTPPPTGIFAPKNTGSRSRTYRSVKPELFNGVYDEKLMEEVHKYVIRNYCVKTATYHRYKDLCCIEKLRNYPPKT